MHRNAKAISVCLLFLGGEMFYYFHINKLFQSSAFSLAAEKYLFRDKSRSKSNDYEETKTTKLYQKHPFHVIKKEITTRIVVSFWTRDTWMQLAYPTIRWLLEPFGFFVCHLVGQIDSVNHIFLKFRLKYQKIR